MAFKSVQKGDRLGEFVLDEMIGQGPTCDVWKARHHVLEGRAVVKVGRQAEASRILHGAGIAQHRVRHERVPRTLGLNLDHDPPFLVTEPVDGSSLRQLLTGGGLTWDKTLDLFRDVLAALDAAHEIGVAHCNLKPENVISGKDGRWYVTDFCGSWAGSGPDSAIVSGVFAEDEKGRLEACAYAPPELGSGGEAGPKTDVWSCGLLLFEALSGRLPQGSETPSEVVQGLPPQADEVFRRSYSRPEKRFETAHEMAAALFRTDAPEEPEELVAKIVSVKGSPAKGDVPEAVVEEIKILSAAARCPACGHRNGIEYKFCVRCGSPLSSGIGYRGFACSSCGRPKFHRHRFCSFCGGRYS